ncbi:MAG: hypothetical protein U0935_02510 [Pirellulales bacterium]
MNRSKWLSALLLFAGVLAVTTPVPAANPHLAAPRWTLVPAAPGEQLVRVSLPLPPDGWHDFRAVTVQAGDTPPQQVSHRVVSWWPNSPGRPRAARRILLTFPWRFVDRSPVEFTLLAPSHVPASNLAPNATTLPRVDVRDDRVRVEWPGDRFGALDGGPPAALDLRWLAPPREGHAEPRVETVEDQPFFRWQRWHFGDPRWPRVIECRVDALGGVLVVGHLQRGTSEGQFAPTLGWECRVPARTARGEVAAATSPATLPWQHPFHSGTAASAIFDERLIIYHPRAPYLRRGQIELTRHDEATCDYRYLRCRDSDQVPFPWMSWQRCEIALGPVGVAPWTRSLISPHQRLVDAATWQAAYPALRTLPPLSPELAALVDYHRSAVTRSAAVGDDFGNVTQFVEGAPHGAVFGMNRLNHGAAIFEDAWRGHDDALLATALDWTDNFHDQSIWWGEKERGGTRYNNVAAQRQTPPTPDYMWRSNDSVSFCTKGYDCFWLAWEETGDPRFLEAFQAQVAYAARHLHAGATTCRNVGDVRDFIRLYRYTGEPRYLEESLRLFRELRVCLSPDFLFDEGGKPLNPDPPYIEDDERGHVIGYAKPYIIGYALAGLPELLPYAPQEPGLRETVRAVADFLATTVDPAGGWRYPHPRSSFVTTGQAIEHAWQLVQACRALGPEPRWLDAIETVLRARTLLFRQTGSLYAGLAGWETSTGAVAQRGELNQRYRKPEDRDRARDYTAGQLGFGSVPPEGLVYFPEVLGYYLEQRPAARLLAAPGPDEPLGQILQRAPVRPR